MRLSTRAKFCRFEGKDLPESPLESQRAFDFLQRESHAHSKAQLKRQRVQGTALRQSGTVRVSTKSLVGVKRTGSSPPLTSFKENVGFKQVPLQCRNSSEFVGVTPLILYGRPEQFENCIRAVLTEHQITPHP